MTRFAHTPLPSLLAPCGRTAEILSTTVAHMETAQSSLMIWSGLPGMGKTCASQQLAAYLCKACGGQQTTACSMRWGGALRGRSARGMRRALTAVYRKFVANESDAFLKKLPEEQLAEDIIESFRRLDTVLLCIDEAGTMSADEMRGVGMIVDAAIDANYRLHVLLISMDDITPKLLEHPVLESRATLDCDFAPWDAKKVLRLLHRCGASLTTALAGMPDAGLALAGQLLAATGGDLRTITVLAQRMNTALAKPLSKHLTPDVSTLATACIAEHRRASEARAGRANIGVLGKRHRKRAA